MNNLRTLSQELIVDFDSERVKFDFRKERSVYIYIDPIKNKLILIQEKFPHSPFYINLMWYLYIFH